MTATDELRRMLSERGVEWENDDCPSFDGKTLYRYTYWGDGGGNTFCEPIGAPKGTLGALCDFSAIGFTPEQAIAATLGARECLLTNAADDLGKGTQSMMCFGCGYTALDDWWDEFNYCPNCGRKVKR